MTVEYVQDDWERRKKGKYNNICVWSEGKEILGENIIIKKECVMMEKNEKKSTKT